jgi:hypothetical protein
MLLRKALRVRVPGDCRVNRSNAGHLVRPSGPVIHPSFNIVRIGSGVTLDGREGNKSFIESVLRRHRLRPATQFLYLLFFEFGKANDQRIQLARGVESVCVDGATAAIFSRLPVEAEVMAGCTNIMHCTNVS